MKTGTILLITGGVVFGGTGLFLLFYHKNDSASATQKIEPKGSDTGSATDPDKINFQAGITRYLTTPGYIQSMNGRNETLDQLKQRVYNDYKKDHAYNHYYAYTEFTYPGLEAIAAGGIPATTTNNGVSGSQIATDAATGAALGTIIPGVGNVVGGAVGGAVGLFQGLFG